MSGLVAQKWEQKKSALSPNSRIAYLLFKCCIPRHIFFEWSSKSILHSCFLHRKMVLPEIVCIFFCVFNLCSLYYNVCSAPSIIMCAPWAGRLVYCSNCRNWNRKKWSYTVYMSKQAVTLQSGKNKSSFCTLLAIYQIEINFSSLIIPE